MMNNLKLLIAPLVGVVFMSSLTYAQNLEEILQKTDRYRSLSTPHFFTYLRISAPGETTRELEAYTDGVQNIVKFTVPAKEKGRTMFREDIKSLWFFIPGNKRLVRISQTQRLTGRVSVGDVLSVSFSLDYEPIDMQPDPEDPNLRVLELKGKTKHAQYRKIMLWIDHKTYQAKKSQHFAISGKMLKTVFYDEYKDFDGQVLQSVLRVQDEIRKEPDTFVYFLNYQPVELPDNFYSKEMMVNL